VTCPLCGEELNPGDRFCEACGEPTALFELTAEGDCRREEDCGAAAAVSDRGRVRPRNEDAYAVAVDETTRAIVVCDGVASTSDSGLAAAAAARCALDHLRDGFGGPDKWADVMVGAISAAQSVLSEPPGAGAPVFEGSTTIVAVLAQAGRLVVGNVGDSRAYWVGGDGSSSLLSTDDTWVREAVVGGIPEAVARHSRRAHEITGWLGPDAEAIDPHVVQIDPPADGLIVVCTDGLWNYAEPAASIAALVRGAGDAPPVGIARHLVQFALDAGGGDNVTVGVVEAPGLSSTDRHEVLTGEDS
jgi:PPM family protein phosphatase